MYTLLLSAQQDYFVSCYGARPAASSLGGRGLAGHPGCPPPAAVGGRAGAGCQRARLLLPGQPPPPRAWALSTEAPGPVCWGPLDRRPPGRASHRGAEASRPPKVQLPCGCPRAAHRGPGQALTPRPRGIDGPALGSQLPLPAARPAPGCRGWGWHSGPCRWVSQVLGWAPWVPSGLQPVPGPGRAGPTCHLPIPRRSF